MKLDFIIFQLYFSLKDFERLCFGYQALSVYPVSKFGRCNFLMVADSQIKL